MDYKAAWNVRFPGVIVFVEKHFLVSLQDLPLDILHLPRLFSGVYLAHEPSFRTSERSLFSDLKHIWFRLVVCCVFFVYSLLVYST